jgi:ABC-type transporter Mla maintaining outer membrane lipid asymmetry ATPase subunit MlaF
MTMIVVSHHIPSTMRMADRVLLILPHARVEGSPDELRASQDPEVANFLDENAADTDEELSPAANPPQPRSDARAGSPR